MIKKATFYTLILSLIFHSTLLADCTINGPVNSNTNPFAGCSGIITLNGTLNINSNYNIAGLGDVTLVVQNGSINWTDNFDFTLSGGSVIMLSNSSLTLTGPCNSQKSIFFGATEIVACNGSGGLSFAEVNAAGGVNASGLPVELVSFSGRSEQSGISLHWQTASETNNSHFEVYRRTNSQAPVMIGRIEGKGTTDQASNYLFTDSQPRYGLNYYYLRQVDFDSKESYSPTIAVAFEQVGFTKLEINPNPVTDLLQITSNQSISRVLLFNQSGNQIPFAMPNTGTKIEVNIPQGLPSGAYFLLVLFEDGSKRESRLIIQ